MKKRSKPVKHTNNSFIKRRGACKHFIPEDENCPHCLIEAVDKAPTVEKVVRVFSSHGVLGHAIFRGPYSEYRVFMQTQWPAIAYRLHAHAWSYTEEVIPCRR